MSSTQDKTMECLVEIFRCVVCMEKLRDPHMCRHCSKLVCYHCIRRWFSEQKSECPHCRAILHSTDLIKVRWGNDVTQQLDSLQQTLPKKKRGTALSLLETDIDAERCSTHLREELSVYCNTCKFCICHECALWSPAHAGHVFKPLDEIYNQHCQQIKEGVCRLRRKFMEIMGNIQDVEKNIEFVRTAKDVRVREIRNAVELMIARLDTHLKTKLLTLVNQKALLSRKSEDLETLLRDIESQLATGPKSELIKHSVRVLKTIQDSVNKSTYSLLPVLADFPSELVPNYDSCTFVIHKFTQLRTKADPFYSDPLHVNGLSWRLKVYPDGNGVVRGTYLSIFLELTAGPPEIAKYEYRIEMIYQAGNDPSKNMMREFASDFEIGECWGYNRFFRLDLLEADGFLDRAQDTIKLRFEVRAPTYYQKCKDQQWYISQLLSTNAKQSGHVAELKARIRDMDGAINQNVDFDPPVTENASGDMPEGAASKGPESLGASQMHQSEVDRLMPFIFPSESESDDDERDDSQPSSSRSEKNVLTRTRRVADENDVDEETTAGDIDVETPGATARSSHSAGSITGRSPSTTMLFEFNLGDSDVDEDEPFDYAQGTSDLMSLLNELQIMDDGPDFVASSPPPPALSDSVQGNPSLRSVSAISLPDPQTTVSTFVLNRSDPTLHPALLPSNVPSVPVEVTANTGDIDANLSINPDADPGT